MSRTALLHPNIAVTMLDYLVEEVAFIFCFKIFIFFLKKKKKKKKKKEAKFVCRKIIFSSY